jgi:tetratricopeptide (TPR) repeat protein
MKLLLNIKTLLVSLAIIGLVQPTLSQNNTAIQAFAKSYQVEKDKDYKNAITALREGFDSTQYESNLRMGWLHYASGFYKGSLSYYKKALAKLPNSEEAKLGLVLPTTVIGTTDEVIAIYKSVLEKNAGNTACCYNLGYIYYNAKDYKNALMYFKKIIDLYPFDYDGLLMTAWTNYQLGNKTEATDLFYKVLLYSPTDQSAVEGLKLMNADVKKNTVLEAAFTKSYASGLKGDYTAAISAIKEVYSNTSYEINLRLGYLSYLGGLHKEAMNYYKIAIDLKPKTLEARFGYVYPAAALGQTNELRDQYQAILQIDAANVTAKYRLGYLNFQSKDYISAYKHSEKSVELYPFSYDGLVLFGKASLQLGKKEEAKSVFNRVLLLSASDKDAREGLNALK